MSQHGQSGENFVVLPGLSANRLGGCIHEVSFFYYVKADEIIDGICVYSVSVDINAATKCPLFLRECFLCSCDCKLEHRTQKLCYFLSRYIIQRFLITLDLGPYVTVRI